MAQVNGNIDSARAAVAEQVKFDILTQSQEAVSPSFRNSCLAEGLKGFLLAG